MSMISPVQSRCHEGSPENDVLVVVVCFSPVTCRSTKPASVITRSFEITRLIHLLECCMISLIIEYLYFFRRIFGGQKFGG